RKDGNGIGIKVSCITDRDIPPKEASDYSFEVLNQKTKEKETRFLVSEKRTEENYTKEQIEQKVSDKKEKYGGGDVQVFLTNTWTLEYEIARSCLRDSIHKAILYAKATKDLEKEITPEIKEIVKKQL